MPIRFLAFGLITQQELAASKFATVVRDRVDAITQDNRKLNWEVDGSSNILVQGIESTHFIFQQQRRRGRLTILGTESTE